MNAVLARPAPPGVRLALAALLALATLALYARSLAYPVLIQDDFDILACSWTPGRAAETLWQPNNEHVMPLGRLLTAGLVRLAGSAAAVPAVVSWVGPAGLLLALPMLYGFCVGETGRPFDGWVACALFGVSSTYQQAVYWFAASFSVLALDTLLLALVAVQCYRRTGRVLYLDLAVLACALAPGWFASGVLAGPLCCLYLLPGDRGDSLPPRRFSLLPLLGTALFLALALLRAGDKVLHAEHYGGQTAVESFRPLTGLVYTGRSLVDNLFLGLLGVRELVTPTPLVALVLLAATGLGAWWWRGARHRRVLLLGLGLVFGSYWLTYSARGRWDYDELMTRTAWSRYHLLPQAGLALFVAGGLCRRRDSEADASMLTTRQARRAAVLVGVCLLVQLPRGLIASVPPDAGQTALLRRIDDVSERCRCHHVSAAQARDVLPPLDLGRWAGGVSGWEFLRASESPETRPADEVRGLLEPE